MAAQGQYPSRTNVPQRVAIEFKFFVDAGNQPILAGWTSNTVNVSGNPLNLGITSVAWVSQGLFRLTLRDRFPLHVKTTAQLNVNAAGQQRFAQPGPVANVGTSSAITVDILVVDNAGAVQNPAAANANNFISGEIVFCDTTSC